MARLLHCPWLRISIFSLLVAVVTACQPRTEVGLGPGDEAPGFSLPAIGAEKTISLADFRGKTVLINFWASWCEPCVSEVPALEKLYQQLAPKGFVVLGVGIDDDRASLDRLRQKFGVTFPLVIDTTGKTKNAYKIQGVPESFVVGPEGKLVLHQDVENGELTVRIIGPRSWSSPKALAVFAPLLPIR